MSPKPSPRAKINHERLLDPLAQKAIKLLPHEEALPLVDILGNGDFVLILVKIRLTLKSIQGGTYSWDPTVYPHETNLLRRLLNAFEQREGGVRYSVVSRLEEVVQAVSKREPPLGTVIEATLTYARDSQPRWRWRCSTIEEALRSHDAAKIAHDQAEQANTMTLAKFFLLGWFLKLTGLGLVPVPKWPDDPPEDTWSTQHRDGLEEVMCDSLLPVLKSLWKAVFVQGEVARQLTALGFRPDVIGQTVMGEIELHGIVRDLRSRKDES